MSDRLSNLLSRIPGYDGYRVKESMRDTDRVLRESIANDLSGFVDRLTVANASLANARELTLISRIEATISRVRLLADRVRTASYGYGGIFTQRSVDENALAQLRQFDLAFQRAIPPLDQAATQVAKSAHPLESDLADFDAQLATLSRLFDSRSSVIESAKPSQDADILGLLEDGEESIASPLSALNVGDAVSVLGDNYLVDATVRLESGDTSLLLARVDASANTWLLGASDSSVGPARVTEDTTAGGIIDASFQAAKVTVETRNGGRETAPGEYVVISSGDDPIVVSFRIGDAFRQFRGTVINALDIEVFGAAATQEGN